MSLNVPTDLLERAEAGEVPDAEFVGCVRESLPYAWTVISEVAAELHSDGGEFADHAVPPPSEAERGQLLRALASDAIRGGHVVISPIGNAAMLQWRCSSPDIDTRYLPRQCHQ